MNKVTVTIPASTTPVSVAIPSSAPPIAVQFGTVQGGTNNYNRLRNKPTLNSVEIVGDKTSEDYGLGPSMWFGTLAEYNALPAVDPNVCYFIEEGT